MGFNPHPCEPSPRKGDKMLPGRSRDKGREPALSASRAQGLHPGRSGGAGQRRARAHLGSSMSSAWRLFLLLQWERIRLTHVSMFSIPLSFCPTFWEISSTFSTKISVERLVVLFHNLANLSYLLARPLVSWTREPPLSLQKRIAAPLEFSSCSLRGLQSPQCQAPGFSGPFSFMLQAFRNT